VVTLAAATDRYVLALVGDLRSDETVRTYETLLVVFRRWLSERLGRAPTVADLTADHARSFATDLLGRGRSRDTVRQYLSVLKLWAAFLAREYRWPEHPLAALSPGRRHRRPVEVFTEAEVARMVDAIGRTKRSYHLRNRAAIFLLLDTGLRVSELCDLELGDVTLATARADGEVRIRHGKGDKPRGVKLKAKASRELELYVEDERPEQADKAAVPCPRLFLGAGGGPWTRQGVAKLVAYLGRRAGVEGKRVSPHTFRSTFATETILAGNPVFSVQAALGHANASQTAHYVSAAELGKAPFVSPLERWRAVR
jgi:integrase/recombinase XerC/integrase/recombinase XerD